MEIRFTDAEARCARGHPAGRCIGSSATSPIVRANRRRAFGRGSCSGIPFPAARGGVVRRGHELVPSRRAGRSPGRSFTSTRSGRPAVRADAPRWASPPGAGARPPRRATPSGCRPPLPRSGRGGRRARRLRAGRRGTARLRGARAGRSALAPRGRRACARRRRSRMVWSRCRWVEAVRSPCSIAPRASATRGCCAWKTKPTRVTRTPSHRLSHAGSHGARPRCVSRVLASGPLVGVLEGDVGVAGGLHRGATHGSSACGKPGRPLSPRDRQRRHRSPPPRAHPHATLRRGPAHGTQLGSLRRSPVDVGPGPFPVEAPVATAPAHRFAAAARSARGLALLLPGFAEIEWTRSGDLLLTLLRAVGSLSRGDLPVRPGHAAWPEPTPLAQCPGRAGVELAILPGYRARAGSRRTASSSDGRKPFFPCRRTGFPTRPTSPSPPDPIALEGEGLVLSAMKTAEEVRRDRPPVLQPASRAGRWCLDLRGAEDTGTAGSGGRARRQRGRAHRGRSTAGVLGRAGSLGDTPGGLIFRLGAAARAIDLVSRDAPGLARLGVCLRYPACSRRSRLRGAPSRPLPRARASSCSSSSTSFGATTSRASSHSCRAASRASCATARTSSRDARTTRSPKRRRATRRRSPAGGPRTPASSRTSSGWMTRARPLLEVKDNGQGASPHRFRGTTLFDWLRSTDSGSRVLSVSRKDRGAILPVGRSRGDVYWFDSGLFTTSTWYRTADTLPGWVREFNVGRAGSGARRLDLVPSAARLGLSRAGHGPLRGRRRQRHVPASALDQSGSGRAPDRRVPRHGLAHAGVRVARRRPHEAGARAVHRSAGDLAVDHGRRRSRLRARFP